MFRGGQRAGPVRVAILFLVLLLLLLPQYRFWGPVSPLLLGGPVVLALVWGRTDRDFALWAGYITTFLVFVTLRQFADDLGPPAFIDYPIAVDRFFSLGQLPTLWLQERFYVYGSRSWFDVAMIGVHLSYYLAPPVVGLALWRWRPRVLPIYLQALSLTLLLSLPIHYAFPTVPPWMASILGEIPRVYRIVGDIWQGLSPNFYEFGYQVTSGNDVAAMPSTHTALIAVITAACWSLGSWWKALGVSYLLAMGLALVYLGEHYVVDVIAAILVALLCWSVVARWEGRRNTTEGPDITAG